MGTGVETIRGLISNLKYESNDNRTVFACVLIDSGMI